jgi:CheY-like chemotaxis protein
LPLPTTLPKISFTGPFGPKVASSFFPAIFPIPTVTMEREAEERPMEPTWKANETVPSLEPPSATYPEPQLRVLVVEDQVDAADTLAALLRREGHTVEVAYSGPEGVEAWRRCRPDVVLLDLGLPGVDGWEVATLLRTEATSQDPKSEKQPLIVAVTGLDGDEERKRSDAVGIALHLVKPTDPERLLALLRRFSSVVN